MPPYFYRIRTRHALTPGDISSDRWMTHELNADSIDEARAICIQCHADRFGIHPSRVEVVETLAGWPIYPHIR